MSGSVSRRYRLVTLLDITDVTVSLSECIRHWVPVGAVYVVARLAVLSPELRSYRVRTVCPVQFVQPISRIIVIKHTSCHSTTSPPLVVIQISFLVEFKVK